MRNKIDSEPARCRYCHKAIAEPYTRTRPHECKRCGKVRTQLYFARRRSRRYGIDMLRTDVVIRTILVTMADEPVDVQMKAITDELIRQGLHTDRPEHRDLSDEPLHTPQLAWKVWTEDRLALLQDLLSQGKTEAEIAKALSMMEKQVRVGMRMLRNRDGENSAEYWGPQASIIQES